MKISKFSAGPFYKVNIKGEIEVYLAIVGNLIVWCSILPSRTLQRLAQRVELRRGGVFGIGEVGWVWPTLMDAIWYATQLPGSRSAVARQWSTRYEASGTASRGCGPRRPFLLPQR